MNAPPPPPPPPPAAAANAFFDLSLLPGSNGTGREPRADRGYVLIAGNQDPRVPHYLSKLSGKYSSRYGVAVQFTNLPQGYTLWWKAKSGRFTRNGTPVGAFYVYGHPRGPFRSVGTFIVHLHSMINNVAPCQCVKC
ncbi:hypothetical protein KCU95_g8411, partial [Aureobasidium melanogenum]